MKSRLRTYKINEAELNEHRQRELCMKQCEKINIPTQEQQLSDKSLKSPGMEKYLSLFYLHYSNVSLFYSHGIKWFKFKAREGKRALIIRDSRVTMGGGGVGSAEDERSFSNAFVPL